MGLRHALLLMKISASTLNRKINSFLAQLQVDDQHAILYPSDMDLERAKTVAKAQGWKAASCDVFMPCYSLDRVVVRRLA